MPLEEFSICSISYPCLSANISKTSKNVRMGMASFSKYTVVCVLSHHAVLLALDYFSVAHVGLLLLRIVASAALTTCCILALEGIRSQKKQ